MKIKLISVGGNMPNWVSQGYANYAKRLPKHCQLELHHVPINKRHKNADIPRLIAAETKQMFSFIKEHDFVIALDVQGKCWSTQLLANKLAAWQSAGQTICLLIGGPEGLAAESLAKAQETWSLSKLTLPHPLVRVILAEQIYRAWSILEKHPYHR